MNVVVSGAAGFVGRATVRALARAGHRTVGIVRRSEQARVVEADGGTAVRADLLVPSDLPPAVRGAEVVIHLAQTHADSMETRRAVRVDGGLNLVRAARAAGASRCVVGSGYWVYADHAGVIEEESPIAPLSISRVNHDAEEALRSAGSELGLEVAVVRPGMIYGEGSWFAEMVEELRSGTYRYVQPGDNFLSPIRWEDAGEAFRAVSEKGSPGATYLAVDDRPVTTRSFAAEVAAWLGTKPPRGFSFEEASRAWGEEIARLNAASRNASNRKLRSLGWRPAFPTYREGVPPLLASWSPTVQDTGIA